MRLEKAGQRREGLINYLKELGVYLGFSILSVVLHVGAKQLEFYFGKPFGLGVVQGWRGVVVVSTRGEGWMQ